MNEQGKSFYYENHLTTLANHPHERSKWFDVACCPPNVARLIGLLPSLIFSTENSTIAVHLFLASTFNTTLSGNPVTVTMETDLPWSGSVKLTVQSSSPPTLAIRVPAWAGKTYKSSVQGQVKDGYLYAEVVGGSSPSVIELHFPTTPRFIYAHPSTRKDEVAVMRGPLVYCAEGVDNDFNLEYTAVRATEIKETGMAEVAGVKDVPILELTGKVKSEEGWGEEVLYREKKVEWEEEERKVKMLPYFLRMNRGGNGAMRVWLKELGS